MSAIILQDEIVHYEVLGRGRPLIFLHGWVGSWRYWVPTMQAASTTYRTYALDLWGFGDTAKNPLYYSIENQMRLLEAFLDEMGIGKIAVVGHGLGAVVALLYAGQQASYVDRLMTVSLPNGTHTLNPRLYTAGAHELADWLLGRSSASEAARAEAPKTDPKAVQLSLANLQEMNLGELSYNLVAPCLMVYGQNDPAVEGPSTDQPDKMPEHVHQVVFEQSGHFPMLDETSKFNRLLIDFLSLNTGESPRHLQLKEEWKRRVR